MSQRLLLLFFFFCASQVFSHSTTGSSQVTSFHEQVASRLQLCCRHEHDISHQLWYVKALFICIAQVRSIQCIGLTMQCSRCVYQLKTWVLNVFAFKPQVMSGLQGVKSQVSKSSEVSSLFFFLLESLLNQKSQVCSYGTRHFGINMKLMILDL